MKAKLAVLLLLAGGRPALAAPFTLGGPGVDPRDFRVTVFAQGLNYPKGMALLADGSLLVATSAPSGGSTGFYNSIGAVVRLIDSNGDGVADSPPAVMFSGLPGSLSGLRAAGPLVFVVSTGKQISILREGPTPAAALGLAGKITFTLPSGWLHPPSDLEVRKAPGAPGSYELFFQLGSESNFTATVRTAALGSDLGVSGMIRGDSIYRVTVTDHGDRLSGSGLTRIATGLRNAAGYALHPVTGDLYFQDNGIDGLQDPNEPFSADELNFISAGEIGGAVEDFGFPASYTAYRTGTVVGGSGIQPLVAFQPLPDPTSGEESEGAAEIAFAPAAFPPSLRGGIFVGFHGKFTQGGLQNEENALVHADPETGKYFHVVRPRQAGVGHLDGLLSTRDSLFVADLSPGGSLSSGSGTGVIYQIQAILFIRGDSNQDGRVDLSDALSILAFLFLEQELSRLDAADANDDGQVDISDAVAVLFSLFADDRDLRFSPK